ncbi:hypothetical protein [Treponema sp.]|uniref:hypothetical protein n=1 Tax=Treponema sp. TaxID=166 RepID=UPI00388F738D
MEKVDAHTLLITELAAYLHDIGVKVSKEKYGNSQPQHQEAEGPVVAKNLLEPLGLPARIFISAFYFIETAFWPVFVYLFMAEEPTGYQLLVLIFSIGLGLAFLAAGINILMARIEYDDEKLITRSFKKQKVFYFKDICFFGKRIGTSTGKTRISYWIIKTKEETSHIDIPVNFQTQEFEDFIAAMQRANPNMRIKM